MDMKHITIIVTIMVIIGYSEGKAALRRKPKVYNALITTDEDLVQSRAYPVIQPTIHESGIAHYGPYGPFNPYGVYNPHVVRLAQPIAPALTPKEHLPYPLPSPQFPPQIMQQPLMPQPLSGYPLPQNPPTAPEAENPQAASIPPTGLEEQPQPTVQPPTVAMQSAPTELPKDPNQPTKMPSEQLPIPLNQYGLPPSLIPLRQPQSYSPRAYPYGPQPFHLPPYRFNQISPLYYNTLPGLRQQFLPPYDYLPTGPQFPLSNTIPREKLYPQPPSQPQPLPTVAPTLPPLTTAEEPTESSVPSTESTAPEPAFENIKNGSKSKDSNVPDVPPPPIPSGAKSKQS
ncbi:extensin [Lucilia cuprina]|uniref:extensin n=1 Tax=Lucilia cuprina TaxID=7375 RepID=UPI001F058EAD|nr:extensin [Lucilia cuprina]